MLSFPLIYGGPTMKIINIQHQKRMIKNHLASLPAVFKTTSGQYYSVTFAANSGKAYQVTFWDEYGRPVSDTKHNDVDEITDEYWVIFKKNSSSEELDNHIKAFLPGKERHA